MRQVNSSDNGPIVLDDLETYQPLEVKSDVAKLSQADWTGKQIARSMACLILTLMVKATSKVILKLVGQPKALNRYASAVQIVSNKLNSQITYDIRPAIDATGDNI